MTIAKINTLKKLIAIYTFTLPNKTWRPEIIHVKILIPWQYSGKEVRVRICEGEFEAYDGEVRIAHFKAEHSSGKIVFLKGQYTGLVEKHGIAVPLSYALQEKVSVEVRPLSDYDKLTGVAAHG